MKKMPLILILGIFSLLLFYLHQKIQIYTVAFELSKNYQAYQELTAQRDYLQYTFSQKTSLASLGNWVADNNFSAPDKERVFAFRPGSGEETQVVRQSFFERFHIPASISEVFARDR